MLTGIILSLITLVTIILEFLPNLDVKLPDGITENITQIFRGLGYFIPINLIRPIITIILGYYLFRFLYSIFIQVRSWVYGW